MPHRTRSRFQSRRALAAVTLLTLLATACGGDPPIGPDALRPDTFELVGARGSTLPVFAYNVGFGGTVWLRAAQLKSVEPGRTIDPRIFEDRSGNGPSGGGTRDSTTVSARMADVRVFEERQGQTTVVGVRRDSSEVIVERRGDLLLVRRAHPDPARQVVDTGRFDNGFLVMRVGPWENGGFQQANALFTYRVTTLGN